MKYQPGEMVMANNGRGDVYMIEKIIPASQFNCGPYYQLSNGAVNIKKRARSGWHRVDKVDRHYKKVN